MTRHYLTSIMLKQCIHTLVATIVIHVFMMQTDSFVMTSNQVLDQTCVCSLHTSLFVYPIASESSKPIDVLYTDDCRLYDNSSKPVGNFLPVVSKHQTGYVFQDSDVYHVSCPVFQVDNGDKLTTTIPPPTTPTTSPTTQVTVPTTTSRPHTTPKITTPAVTTTTKPSSCNTVALFTEIAYKKNIGFSQSVKCSDGVHYDSDAVISAFCAAPDPSLWLPGVQASKYCRQIAQFTPIAIFDNQSKYQKNAGILLECYGNIIYVAMQDCNNGLQIFNFTAKDNPPHYAYHVIEWP
ncbi:hypothetical protein ACF0H5_020037 [Mactra antiquata]